MTATDRVLVFDPDPERAASIVALLEETQPWTADGTSGPAFEVTAQGPGPSAGVREIQGGRATLAVVVEAGGPAGAFPGLVDLARKQGVATLLVVDTDVDPKELAGRVRGYDGWVAFDSLGRELPARVADLLHRLGTRPNRLPTIDTRFLALVIHDLRTPLNVIGLTIRAITQTVPNRSAELDEDLTFLQENARQIEKMLAQLGDYCRLVEGESQVSAVEFDPRRFLADFLEDRQRRPGTEPTPVRLEWTDSSPSEVALDPLRVQLALQHSLTNAINAAGEAPVRLRSSGEPGRWVVEIIVDKPPPQTVASIQLRPDRFERLGGTAAERRGLDLAIAARVSEIFGGSARLDVEPGRRSSVVLEWPDRLDGS